MRAETLPSRSLPAPIAPQSPSGSLPEGKLAARRGAKKARRAEQQSRVRAAKAEANAQRRREYARQIRGVAESGPSVRYRGRVWPVDPRY